MSVELICWDFGDTLVDERWLRRPHPAVPDWSDIFDRELARNPDVANGWSLGLTSSDDIVQLLVAHVPALDAADIREQLEGSSREITFFPEAWRSLQRARGQVLQACVTVNADIFTNIVVPEYDLDEIFDTIVASWQMGSRSKVDLTVEARRRLGLDPRELGDTLLIDNKEDNIEEFASAGGRTYLFTGDAAFARDRANGLLPSALVP